MRKSIKDAVDAITAAGFTHIKVELEGDLGRGDCSTCWECEESGRSECMRCDGTGAVETGDYVGVGREPVLAECDDCWGDGQIECEFCDGTGEIGNFTESSCNDIMRGAMGIDTQEALTYGNFYEDGSVDSEYTFTLPVNYEMFDHIRAVQDAFIALAEEVNGMGEIDTRGSGLHIALLTSGTYPSYDALPQEKIRNFRRQTQKLLPALFFMASGSPITRSLSYRQPQVSAHEKYSAIYTKDDTCIEYRLFETCYDNFDAFYDYIQVIAKTLNYYRFPDQQVESLGKNFGFTNGDSVARFFNTPDQLRVLNHQIKAIKPKDKSYKKLKEERGVHYTIKSLTEKQRSKRATLMEDYRQYKRNYEQVMAQPLSDYDQRRVDRLMIESDEPRDVAEAWVRGLEPLMSRTEFIRQNLMPRTSMQVTV